MPRLLEKELQTFNQSRDLLLAKAVGKFALIHESEVVGVYESKMDAVSQGYQKFGNVPFLVKQVLKVEVPHNFVSSLLGV